ncbi:MAG TPA: GTP 3',8-cyclase MoaA [Thermoanaerobaculia bacterium]|nr:GTP 3',8-cyclase MoaA [Thermoanaerobaculia bacterium]
MPFPTPADRLGRPLGELRLSLTDRCNLRCGYCMPREVFGPGFRFLPRGEILTFEEIARLVALARDLGVRKLRLTGGEPLLRTDLPKLVAMLAAIGELEIALTTNGALLAGQAEALARAGLERVNVSLDALDEATFRRMSDSSISPATVLAGIEAADRAGLAPVKINCVVRRGINEHAILDLVRRFRGTGHELRFIEFMDVGNSNGWRLEEVVPADEILRTIGELYPLEPMEGGGEADVARRWRLADGSGAVGVVASVTQPFCSGCNRLRISAEGRAYGCLFAAEGLDLRGPLRTGATDDRIRDLLAGFWRGREDRYSELRAAATPRRASSKIEMSYIGG